MQMPFTKIGVVGGGTMGQGIAEMLAAAGLEVALLEKSADSLAAAMARIEFSLDKQIEKWGITETEKKLILSRIHRSDDLQALGDCQMIIETISEELEEKMDLFRQLDLLSPASAILASNTSTLSLTELAGATNRPERVIGLHFVHPAAKIDLVEIVRGLKTSDAIYERTRYFVEDTIRKKGVMVYESPGFVTTRLINVLINEAMHTLSEGVATAEDIDSAMRIGYHSRYGPLELADRFGLDAVLAAMDRLFREFGDLKYRPSYMLRQMVRAGRVGVKTGEGFFRYDKEGERL